MTATDALSVEHLDVVYRVGDRDRRVLTNISLRVARAESYGLVGESGCGKSTVALAAVRYLARNGRVANGRIMVDGSDLMGLSPAELRRLRAKAVSMVYQDPARALNPTLRIGRQMAEVFEVAAGLTGKAAEARAADMLARVRISSPGRVLASYPHQLSGGMQQRVVIAMALSINPTLLILDEPTTGLDATVAAEVLDLIAQLRTEFDTAILFISHSLPIIARMCSRVGVLYAGELIEEGPVQDVLDDPRHPYTAGLLRSAPAPGLRKDHGRLATMPGSPPPPGTTTDRCIFADRCAIATDICRRQVPPPVDLGGRSSRCFHSDRAAGPPREAEEPPPISVREPPTPMLRARRLSKTYHVGGKLLKAVDDVSFDLGRGETLGLIGESGSGKSSLARLVLGLDAPDPGGSIELAGEELPPAATRRSRAQLKALQIVFQNPGSALNPSHSVRRLIERSLRLTGLTGKARQARVESIAHAVRLTDRHLSEKPRQLSGGLKQRVGIARAFAGGPGIVVCDEPTSALDVSVQAAILNLLVDLQTREQVSYIFITHDIAVVRYLADRVAVLYRGRLLEIGPAEAVFAGPRHPYTEALLSAEPGADGGEAARIRLSGEIPSLLDLPPGCVFQTSCPRKLGPICEKQDPAMNDAGGGHGIRCHIPVAELEAIQVDHSPRPKGQEERATGDR